MRTHTRWIWLFLTAMLLLGVLAGASVAPVSAAEKSLVWERFDVDI